MTTPQRFCPNCGLSADDDSPTCAGCGERLPTHSTPAHSTPAHSTPAASAPTDAPEDQPPWTVAWTVGDITAALFLFLGLLFAVAFAAPAIGALMPAHENALTTWVAVHLVASCSLFVIWLMGLRKTASPAVALRLVKPIVPLPMAGLMTFAALGASILASLAYGMVVELLGLEALKPPEIEADTIFSGAGILLTFQALALVTPISEEVLFRGFVLRGLLDRMGVGPAVVASALVFAALHLDAGTIIPIFATGLALGWLYAKTGSLWPCIVAHAGQNALALLVVRAGL